MSDAQIGKRQITAIKNRLAKDKALNRYFLLKYNGANFSAIKINELKT
ncbi:hypothetical protein [Dickeya chrysanthemi]|nr:hypothetical protein [Dickeya chrysanthemi]MCA7006841.1 hypothetical protein [Dickeya chrysanthemi]